MFPYHSKTNGMLFSDKSFCLLEINGWPLPPKNFTILTQKIKPGEEWKDMRVNCQYWAGILGYLEYWSFVTILKRTECFSLTNLFAFWDKCLAIAPKKFHHFNSKNKTSRSVERYRGLLSILYGPMVICTPVCIYTPEEFFCNILPRKLIVEVPNCLILC